MARARPLSHCLQKLDGAKFGIRLHKNYPALTLARLERLLTTCTPIAQELDSPYLAKPESSKALATHPPPNTIPLNVILAYRHRILTQGSGVSGSSVGYLNCKNLPHFSKLVRSINTRNGVLG